MGAAQLQQRDRHGLTRVLHGDRTWGWWPEVVLGAGGLAVAVELPLLVAGGELVHEAGWLVGTALTVALAAHVRRRQPDHPLSGWFALSAGLIAWQELLGVVLVTLGEGQDAAWVIAAVNLVSQELEMASIVASLHWLGLFPAGRVQRRLEARILRIGWLAVAIPGVLAVSTRMVPLHWWSDRPPVDNPWQVLPLSVDLATAQNVLAFAELLSFVAVAMLVLRYRRSGPAVRRQIRWLLLPAVVIVIGLLANLLLHDTQGLLINGILLSVGPMVAIAFTIGLLQPKGLDPDQALRRSMVYGVIWLTIVALYVGAGTVVGVTAGRYLSVGWAAALTVLVTLAFQPVRSRLERVADRFVFGTRTDPARVIARLGRTLADTYDLRSLLPRMAATLEHGLDLEWARVRLLPGPRSTATDDVEQAVSEEVAAGVATSVALSVPIVLGDRQLGVVECGPRRAGPLTSDDRAVVETLAGQAALAVSNLRLTAELTAQADQIATSRTRLVRAQEAERRRIERNIHDGIQQELVALIGQAGHMLQTHGDKDGSGRDLAELHYGLRRVLDDLRDLARGIHPTILANRGLLAAVESLAARHPVPVEVRADMTLRGLRFPPEIEGAGYFTVAEALTNSLKHAAATVVDIELSRSNGYLRIRVRDDGRGFDPGPGTSDGSGILTWDAGMGLAGMAERLNAVGGWLDVTSTPGGGTTVDAQLSVDGTGP